MKHETRFWHQSCLIYSPCWQTMVAGLRGPGGLREVPARRAWALVPHDAQKVHDVQHAAVRALVLDLEDLGAAAAGSGARTVRHSARKYYSVYDVKSYSTRNPLLSTHVIGGIARLSVR